MSGMTMLSPPLTEREREEDRIYDPYFDELLEDLRRVFQEAKAREAIHPVTANSLKNMVLPQKDTEKAPYRRLPGSVYHTNLDEVLVGMLQGKRVGRANKPLLKGSLLAPLPFPKVYRWSSEPHITEAQCPPSQPFKSPARTSTPHLGEPGQEELGVFLPFRNDLPSTWVTVFNNQT